MIFLYEALRSMKTTGAVTLSSPFLVKKMLKPISFENCNTIVEFGAGTGAVTKSILAKINNSTDFLVFEINKTFYDELLKINTTKRLNIYNENVENLKSVLAERNISKVDHIVSGLPLAIFDKKTVNNILLTAMDLLKPGGKYIQFQYSTTSLSILQKYFSVDIDFTPINIPPAFVYICTKK